jgi:hypothetical protein
LCSVASVGFSILPVSKRDSAGASEINQKLFPWETPGATLFWLYEEIERVGQGEQSHFVHSILFSNGWEARLPFREVRLTTAEPTFPLPRTPQFLRSTSASQSA